jgi:hypothetical protein
VCLTVEEKHRVARQVASEWCHNDPTLFDDLCGDIWEKYLNSPPLTFRGAQLFAFQAVINYYRRDKQQRAVSLIPDYETQLVRPPSEGHDGIPATVLLNEMRERAPEEFEEFVDLWRNRDGTSSSATRVRMFRLRHRILKKLARKEVPSA